MGLALSVCASAVAIRHLLSVLISTSCYVVTVMEGELTSTVALGFSWRWWSLARLARGSQARQWLHKHLEAFGRRLSKTNPFYHPFRCPSKCRPRTPPILRQPFFTVSCPLRSCAGSDDGTAIWAQCAMRSSTMKADLPTTQLAYMC